MIGIWKFRHGVSGMGIRIRGVESASTLSTRRSIDSGFGVQGSGFRSRVEVEGSPPEFRFRVQVQGLSPGFRIQGSGSCYSFRLKVQVQGSMQGSCTGFRFEIQGSGSGFRVQVEGSGSGLRV